MSTVGIGWADATSAATTTASALPDPITPRPSIACTLLTESYGRGDGSDVAWGVRAINPNEDRLAGLRLRRPARLPAGGLLVGPADAQRRRFVAGVTEDLQGQRHAVRREAARNREATETEVVTRAREVRRGARLIGAVDRDRRGLGGRRQDRVDAAEGRCELALVVIALRQRQEIVARRDGLAELDARPHVRIGGQRRIVDEMADETIAFGADDRAGGLGVVAQAARKIGADDLGAESGKRAHRGVVRGQHLFVDTRALDLGQDRKPKPRD